MASSLRNQDARPPTSPASPPGVAVRGVALALAAIVVTAAGLFGAVPATWGVEARSPVTVEVRDYRFTPQRVTVPAGGSVAWRVVEGVHTITAENGMFDSDERTAGDVFVLRFDVPGRYAYYCDYDRTVGMTGVVDVRGAAGGAVTPETTATTAPSRAAAAGDTTTTTAAPTTTTTVPPTTTTVPFEPREFLSPTASPPPAPPGPDSPPPEATADPGPSPGADPAPPAALTDASEASALRAGEDPDPRDTGFAVAIGVVLAVVAVVAIGYLWYHRPSRYIPA